MSFFVSQQDGKTVVGPNGNIICVASNKHYAVAIVHAMNIAEKAAA